jgi:hypothetical protein
MSSASRRCSCRTVGGTDRGRGGIGGCTVVVVFVSRFGSATRLRGGFGAWLATEASGDAGGDVGFWVVVVVFVVLTGAGA